MDLASAAGKDELPVEEIGGRHADEIGEDNRDLERHRSGEPRRVDNELIAAQYILCRLEL